ncbi:MAG: hypothetical protein ACRDGS_00745, partial [Chloroflexota bacterium]
MHSRYGRAIFALGLAISLAAPSFSAGTSEAAGFVKPTYGGGLSPSDILRLKQNAHDNVLIIL